MLCINSNYSHTPEAESSDQPGSKSKAKSYRENSKACAGRDHNHTNPEYVWGDEGPVNERQETLNADCRGQASHSPMSARRGARS
jgi:hypothetical protein